MQMKNSHHWWEKLVGRIISLFSDVQNLLKSKDKDDEVVEYALSRSLSPTMVAEYQLCLPDKRLLEQKMKELDINLA